LSAVTFQRGGAGLPVREEPELAARLHERLSKAPDFPSRAGLLTELGGAVGKSADALKAVLAAEKAEATASRGAAGEGAQPEAEAAPVATNG
jgi:hypothetical protein